MTGTRFLVPVARSETLRATVAHAVRTARDRAAETGSDAVVHFVYTVSTRVLPGEETEETDAAADLLDRIEVWTAEDLGEDDDAVTIETAVIGAGEYLFAPDDFAGAFRRYARTHDLESVLFDPEYSPVGTMPLLPSLEAEVRRAGLTVEEAPRDRERRAPVLARRGTVEQFLALFGISFAFYLVLAGSLAPYELATGAITGLVVAVALWRVSLTTPIASRRTAMQVMRLAIYTPFLLWEIAKANLEIAYVVLHPSLPIDPATVEFEAALWTPLPVTTLANSITLTPGTLTVDVNRRAFTVHALTENARESLLAGALERGVRFVFYGRSAARIPGPAERNADRGEGETE